MIIYSKTEKYEIGGINYPIEINTAIVKNEVKIKNRVLFTFYKIKQTYPNVPGSALFRVAVENEHKKAEVVLDQIKLGYSPVDLDGQDPVYTITKPEVETFG